MSFYLEEAMNADSIYYMSECRKAKNPVCTNSICHNPYRRKTMKITTKVLSVLLAVIMLVSSVSVCFGSITFAAGDAISQLVAALESDAMKSFNAVYTTAIQGSDPNLIRTNTYTVKAQSYAEYEQLINLTKKFNTAIQSIDEYKNKHSHGTDSNCASSSDICTDFAALRTALVDAMTPAAYNALINQGYRVDKFFDCVLSMENVSYARSKGTYHTSTGWSYSAKSPLSFFNELVITTDIMDYLKSFSDVDSAADEVATTYTYRTAMGRQLYTTSASWGRTNYFGHSCVNTQQIGYFSQSIQGEAIPTNASTLKNMKEALKNNRAYMGKSAVYDIHKISDNPTVLGAAADELDDAYKAVVDAFGEDNAAMLIDYYFNTNGITADGEEYKISYSGILALIKSIRNAAIISGYKDTCDIIKRDYKIYVDEAYKTYTSTKVNTLYNELSTAYGVIMDADDSVKAAVISYYGLSDIIDNIPDVLEALSDYYYEIFLGSIDERAFGGDSDLGGYVKEYLQWTVEDIDNDSITTADILTALSEVTLDIDTISTEASEDDILDYFAVTKSELMGVLTQVQTYLEKHLGKYAGLNDELYAQYKSFISNIADVIDADSSRLYEILSENESWHQELQDFFLVWSKETGEYKDLLEDNLQLVMNDYMAQAYAALKARVTTQIDSAYGLYEAYYELYENNVTMASLTAFNNLKRAIETIEAEAYSWMKSAHDTYGTAITQESIDKYGALEVIYGQYGTFVANRGFDHYSETKVETIRPDTENDIARKNENGEYRVADEDAEKVIALLEEALKNKEIKRLLGGLVGYEGEEFTIGGLLNSLIEGIYSDELINTIISFVYPVVSRAFLDVWEGINPVVKTKADIGLEVDINAKLSLYDVDAAIEAAGMALAPINLAHFIEKNPLWATEYSDVIGRLKSVKAQTSYDMDGDYVDPWQDEALYDYIVDESGISKRVMQLNWGVTDRATFIEALSAALSGLEPIIAALILNKQFTTPDTEDPSGGLRGGKIGASIPGQSTVSVSLVSAPLELDPITIMLQIKGNDGWDNVFAPVFEALGLENIPHSEDMHSVKDLLEKGIFSMLDQLIARLDANPIGTIFDALPNIIYAIEADLIAPLLSFLETEIYYEADVHYVASILGYNLEGNLQGALKAEKNEHINIGEILDLEAMGINLSGGLEGILQMAGISLPYIDTSVLATVGELKWTESNRSRYSYTYRPEGVSESQVAYIDANRADLFEYILRWALSNSQTLLGMLDLDADSMGKVVSDILDNISADADGVTAAAVELFNQRVYDTLEEYEWYTGVEYATSTESGLTPAGEIYMTFDEWTQEKADSLYDNLEAILGAVFTIAEIDFDKSTPEADGSLEEAIGSIARDVFSDKTLTSLAGLMAELDLGTISGVDINSLVWELTGIDLKAVSDKYSAVGAALEADPLYVHNFGVDSGEKTFSEALVEILRPFSPLLDFILRGEELTITIGSETVELIGSDGYDSAFVPLLEALGYEAEEADSGLDALEAILDVLSDIVGRLTTNTPENKKDGAVYTIIDMLPGVIYFIASDGLSVAVRNLLHPFYVLLDIIRPVYDVDIDSLAEGVELGRVPLNIDLDSLNVELIVDIASELTGLDLTEVKTLIYDVCRFVATDYESASSLIGKNGKRGAYTAEFTQADLLTVVVRRLLGEDIYELILSLINMPDIPVQNFNWLDTDKADTDEIFSAINSSELYEGYSYGPQYTKEMAQYVADNFGDFIDNIIYLAGIRIGGKNVDTLKELIEGFLGGSLYNSSNVVLLRDTLAKIADDITKLEVNSQVVGTLIADVMRKTGIADIGAIAEVEIPEFTDDREQFVKSLCDVLEPLYGILKFVLADEDITFFSSDENAISLEGAEGYAFGIIPVLEVLGCKDIFTPDEYYAAVKSDGDVLLTSLINPVLDRVDEILGCEDPAQEILDMLPNIIYFINSNGVDTVVKNTLNAVYSLLGAIEPVAKLDLYELIGVDLATIDFEWLFNKVLEIIADKTGYEFENLDADAIKELTVGRLISYTSVNGKRAYKMVYAGDGAEAGTRTEMVVVVERLLITFIMHENNRNMLLGLMRDYLGMTAEAEKYVAGILEAIAEISVETKTGMDTALTTLYYIYFAADKGVGNTASGIKDINKIWTEILRDMRESDDEGEAMAGEIIAGILDMDIFDDIIDPEEGIAPNGIIRFFMKIAEFFRKLFSFGE